MAVYRANLVRAVAIEVREKILTLYLDALTIYQGTHAWTLNGLDPMLPPPFAVKVQLDAYKALKLESLKLTDWVTSLQQAQPDDVLTYPPPPDTGSGTGLFDGSSTFDGSTTFDGAGGGSPSSGAFDGSSTFDGSQQFDGN